MGDKLHETQFLQTFLLPEVFKLAQTAPTRQSKSESKVREASETPHTVSAHMCNCMDGSVREEKKSPKPVTVWQ